MTTLYTTPPHNLRNKGCVHSLGTAEGYICTQNKFQSPAQEGFDPVTFVQGKMVYHQIHCTIFISCKCITASFILLTFQTHCPISHYSFTARRTNPQGPTKKWSQPSRVFQKLPLAPRLSPDLHGEPGAR